MPRHWKRGRFPYSAKTWCRGTRQRSVRRMPEASLEAWPLPLHARVRM